MKSIMKVCSSSDYKSSRESHMEELRKNHEENAKYFSSIQSKFSNIKAKPTEYKIWGEWHKINPKAPEGAYDGFEVR